MQIDHPSEHQIALAVLDLTSDTRLQQLARRIGETPDSIISDSCVLETALRRRREIKNPPAWLRTHGILRIRKYCERAGNKKRIMADTLKCVFEHAQKSRPHRTCSHGGFLDGH